MAKLTAVVKSPEEILGPGAKGVRCFTAVNDHGNMESYAIGMTELAGKRIEVELRGRRLGVYFGSNWNWLKEWLRDFEFEEDVDWSQVPVDAKVLANGHKRHFAKYENGLVYVWDNGSTSFSANNGSSPWSEVRLYREDNQ